MKFKLASHDSSECKYLHNGHNSKCFKIYVHKQIQIDKCFGCFSKRINFDTFTDILGKIFVGAFAVFR